MISSRPIFEMKCERTVGVSGIIKAPFHPLVPCPAAVFLDVCNRHIIYLKPRPGRITARNLKALQKIKVPQSKSGFPPQIQHKNCFRLFQTRAHVLHALERSHGPDFKRRPALIFHKLCFWGGSSLLKTCCDEAK